MEKEILEIEIVPAEVGTRIDKVLAMRFKQFSRTKIEHMIAQGLVLINGVEMVKSYKPVLGDIVALEPFEEEAFDAKPEHIPLDVVYEDSDIIVINKPVGMVVHPAPGNYTGTLVNALLYHCRDLSNINGVLRPGIVHRIDKDTSGLLVAAKNDFAHMRLSEQLQTRAMKRSYLALVQGVIDEPFGKVVARIGRSPIHRQMMAVTPDGKEATTHFAVIKRYRNYTFIKLELETGRTHQIRVHMAYIRHPIEGDQLYQQSKNLLYNEGQLLHAFRLMLLHPRTLKPLTFEVPLPKHFAEAMTKLT